MDGNGKRKKISLDRVYHVPSLTTNLLSVSKITDNGFEVFFDRFRCRVLKGKQVLLIGERKGGLSYLKQTEQAMLVD